MVKLRSKKKVSRVTGFQSVGEILKTYKLPYERNLKFEGKRGKELVY